MANAFVWADRVLKLYKELQQEGHISKVRASTLRLNQTNAKDDVGNRVATEIRRWELNPERRRKLIQSLNSVGHEKMDRRQRITLPRLFLELKKDKFVLMGRRRITQELFQKAILKLATIDKFLYSFTEEDFQEIRELQLLGPTQLLEIQKALKIERNLFRDFKRNVKKKPAKDEQ